MSTQDDTLKEHFFAFIAGSGGEFGPTAAAELRRIFSRAQRRGDAGSFGGYVARLMIAEDAANAPPTHMGKRITWDAHERISKDGP